MRCFGVALSLLVLLVFQACQTADTADVSLYSQEQIVFQQVNTYRTSRGLSGLEWDDRVAEQARNHSLNMAQGMVPFGHEGFSGRVSALSGQFDLMTAAENVGMTSALDSPAWVVVESWVNSGNHQQNILGEYQLTGVGAAYEKASDCWYFTQIYIQLQP